MIGFTNHGRRPVLSSKLATTVCCALILCAGCAPAASAQVPVHPTVSESLGVNIHFTDARPGELEMLAASGVRWIRMDFIWKDIERRRGQYDFSAYDRLLASLEAHRIRSLWIFDGENPLYDEGRFPYTDEGRRAFARFAAAGVRHFRGKGILWEMWNEPNVHRKESPTPEVYAKLALAVGEAIRKTAPHETYVGPATSLIDMQFLEACFKAGLLRYWSGVTVHPYRFQDPETVIPDYEALRVLIAKYAPQGRTIPAIQGEWGWASVYSKSTLLGWAQMREGMTDELQGELLARQWLTNLAAGIPLSIWYDWHDDGPSPTDPEAHCGMVLYPYHPGGTPVYTPKPAYKAARTLTGLLGEFRFERRLPAGRPEDYVLVFRRGRAVRLAAWSLAGPRSVRIPVQEGPCSVIGHTGEGRETIAASQGSVALALTSAPRYLICGGDRLSRLSRAESVR